MAINNTHRHLGIENMSWVETRTLNPDYCLTLVEHKGESQVRKVTNHRSIHETDCRLLELGMAILLFLVNLLRSKMFSLLISVVACLLMNGQLLGGRVSRILLPWIHPA